MVFVPCLSRFEGEAPRLGEPLLDEYLRFVAARARPNTVLAQRRCPACSTIWRPAVW
jgi:integrase/recombinase XerD